MQQALYWPVVSISIHAPLRERRRKSIMPISRRAFQSTLPYGSDCGKGKPPSARRISIHAPLRERRASIHYSAQWLLFQSTLPYGSDFAYSKLPARHTHFNPRSLTGATLEIWNIRCCSCYFNPRSLTGATDDCEPVELQCSISIHAPLRERQDTARRRQAYRHFNPRSLTGATPHRRSRASVTADFNPRSLTGATVLRSTTICD